MPVVTITPAEADADGDADQLRNTPLADICKGMLQLYQQFLLEYNRDSDSAKHVSPERLLSEYGRLKIWTEQTGATLHGRGSLEDTLQEDSALRADIAGIFQQLGAQLSAASTFESSLGGDTLGSEHETASNFTSDSEYSLSQQSEDGPPAPRPRISRQALLLLHIFEQIALLYQYSAILRRPRLAGRYLHSKSRQEAPSVPSYEFSHVQQKMREWRQARNWAMDDDGEEPAESSSSARANAPSHAAREEASNDDDVLCLRLAAANARRREQLRYWERHPFTGRERSRSPGEESFVEPSQSETQSLPAASESRSRKSNPTVRTFSSVARSAIFETETQGGPSRTVYSESVMADSSSLLRIPKAPTVPEGQSTFECPYCHMMLDSARMQDRNTWKRHVFRDLRPYTCTFPKCSNPDKLYATRRDWTYHEVQMHRRQWNCRACNSQFTAKDSMASHLGDVHGQVWDKSQLPILLEVSEGPAEESKIQTCPFCSEEHGTKRLMSHVAGHLEDLSLFALPRNDSNEIAAEDSSGILSSLDSAIDDISYYGEDPVPEATIDGPFLPKTSENQEIKPDPDNGWENEFFASPNPSSLPSGYTTDTRLMESSVTSTGLTGSPPPDKPGAPGLPPTFACEFCGRHFDQIHKLNHHRRYHERPHECPHAGCNQRFGTKTHLDRHVADKHLKSRKFYCMVSTCPYSRLGGKSFPRKDNWKRHMLKKHDITDVGDPTAEYMDSMDTT